MISIKHVLLWLSMAVVILGLGAFASSSPDRSAAPSPAAARAADPAPASHGELQCAADAVDQPLAVAPAAAACPSGTAFTCCRCGGCGCRPQRISPANWCGC